MTDRALIDVNALAMVLVEDHPGHEHVRSRLEPGLAGEETLLGFDSLPLAAQWVMTAQWELDRIAARNAVSSFLEQPFEPVAADCETLRAAYGISAEKDHDVFDCFYLALSRDHDADALVTTDTDFAALCADESAPDDVLERFHVANG